MKRRSAKRRCEEDIGTVVARYRQSPNMRKVARDFRISRTTVAKYLAERGIDTSRSMKPADVTRAVKLYGVGLSSQAIGQRLGFDSHTILKALRERV
ncbi:helix-turn-helix domain-containing protein [Humibacter ginsengiterrae]